MYEWVGNIALAIVGISFGLAVAGGVFAFITVIGIVPRIAAKMGNTKMLYHFESCIVAGALVGNLASIYQMHIPIGYVGVVLYGLFSGVFTGCLAMALAETLRVLPVFLHRMNMEMGMAVCVLAMALGKGIGAFLQLYLQR